MNLNQKYLRLNYFTYIYYIMIIKIKQPSYLSKIKVFLYCKYTQSTSNSDRIVSEHEITGYQAHITTTCCSREVLWRLKSARACPLQPRRDVKESFYFNAHTIVSSSKWRKGGGHPLFLSAKYFRKFTYKNQIVQELPPPPLFSGGRKNCKWI